MLKIFSIQIVILSLVWIDLVRGHAMLLKPPGRSSRWRYNSSAAVDYNDNAHYCGGFGEQWYTHGGKCGLCGDNYGDPTPRDNELGGKYGGSGVIVETYENTYTANIGVQITTNHLGFIKYEICNMDEYKTESEKCFAKYPLKFADGSDKFYIGTTVGWIESNVVLPHGLKCKHCVLRWTYTTGNSWGVCEDGTGALGCGAQETYKSCADIRIKAPLSRSKLISVVPKQVHNDKETIKAEVPIIVQE